MGGWGEAYLHNNVQQNEVLGLDVAKTFGSVLLCLSLVCLMCIFGGMRKRESTRALTELLNQTNKVNRMLAET
jgi:hypothetical protein